MGNGLLICSVCCTFQSDLMNKPKPNNNKPNESKKKTWWRMKRTFATTKWNNATHCVCVSFFHFDFVDLNSASDKWSRFDLKIASAWMHPPIFEHLFYAWIIVQQTNTTRFQDKLVEASKTIHPTRMKWEKLRKKATLCLLIRKSKNVVIRHSDRLSWTPFALCSSHCLYKISFRLVCLFSNKNTFIIDTKIHLIFGWCLSK